LSRKIVGMFHPGGFGESNESHDREPVNVDPCIIRPIFLLISILLTWVTILILGLQLGFGWYAWPMSTVSIGFGFIAYSFLKWLSSR
jgi:hypothetical protein